MRVIVVLCLFMVTGVVQAASPGLSAGLEKKLLELLPKGAGIDGVSNTGHAGLLEVISGSQVYYLSEDSKFFIKGDLYRLQGGDNLSEQRRSGLRKAMLAKIPESEKINFADKNAKYIVTVFTDADCIFCRRLHSEMDEYRKLGIGIQYMAFPRARPGTLSYQKMISIWCAGDRKQAMNTAKRGETISIQQCENPVSRHHELGLQFGIRGTPSMILEDGRMHVGYVPAKALLGIIQKGKP